MPDVILAVNPGSTSTKLAVYSDENEVFRRSISHSSKELAAFAHVHDQLDFRLALVLDALREENIPLTTLSAVVGRGGLLPPVHPGGYFVNQRMLDVLQSSAITPHASNLGAMIAMKIARPLGIPAYIYDAVSAGDLPEIATITGIPEIHRQSFCHVLNSRATAHKVAKKYGKAYEDMNFVVAHLGGGISFSAHVRGKIVDSMSDDDGAFAPERSGGMPLLSVVELCFSGKYTKKEMLQKVRGGGGLKALLGTSNCEEIEARIASGDTHAELVYHAQAYQIVKGIGVMAAVMKGDIDAVILTGGVAYSKMLTDWVTEYVKFLAPVEVAPGENELESLALGTLRILRGEETAREFNA
jgi:butyrate kinase